MSGDIGKELLEAVLKGTLSTATGPDPITAEEEAAQRLAGTYAPVGSLDSIAEQYAIKRLPDEADAAFRKRITGVVMGGR